MKRLAKLAFVALFIAGSASVANAGGPGHHRERGMYHGGSNRGTSVGISIGRVGISFGTTPRYRNSYHSAHRGYGNYDRAYGRHPTWRDTSHYDYRGPTVVRRGYRYEYTPAHYGLHRTGHWNVR